MNITKLVTTTDTHTASGWPGLITGGIPSLRGESVAEKMEEFRLHHDSIRNLLVRASRSLSARRNAVAWRRVLLHSAVVNLSPWPAPQAVPDNDPPCDDYCNPAPCAHEAGLPKHFPKKPVALRPSVSAFIR